MAFPVELVSTLTGATVNQLAYWRQGQPPVLAAEICNGRPRVLYSFRDMIAIRSFVRLRQVVSLQKIRAAIVSLPLFHLTEHPSEYQFGVAGQSVYVVGPNGPIDPTVDPNQGELYSLDEVLQRFVTKDGIAVVDFLRPRENVLVDPRRIGGWPTAGQTRVPYDDVALLMATGEVGPADVARFYPSVSPEAAVDALDFSQMVSRSRGAA